MRSQLYRLFFGEFEKSELFCLATVRTFNSENQANMLLQADRSGKAEVQRAAQVRTIFPIDSTFNETIEF